MNTPSSNTSSHTTGWNLRNFRNMRINFLKYVDYNKCALFGVTFQTNVYLFYELKEKCVIIAI